MASLWQMQRNAEPVGARPPYTADLNRWLYSKRSPVPGAWVAPMQLPGLRGVWPASLVNETTSAIANAVPLSNLWVWYSGSQVAVDIAPTWPGTIAPYVKFLPNTDSSWNTDPGDAFARHTTQMTYGGWFRLGRLTDETALVYNCDDEGELSSSWLGFDAVTGCFQYRVRPQGAASQVIVTNPTAVEVGQWYFVAGRFNPSTEIACQVDGNLAVNTTDVPASVHDVGATGWFNVQPWQDTEARNLGESVAMSQAWMCACPVPNHVLTWLYVIQAPLFGQV